ncbi:hypothetical protein KIS1582_4980 [Cytobacillus firmus]|uniref:Uncharacterized protein n=1 Tax=Cytobacillus firmus TaxID=1399 RepID=A0A800N898_CYTFI|nr:hypothetical protein KIS1582_4980 [Cytobacillus firmus]
MVGFTARSMPGTGEVNQSYQHPHLIKRWGLFYAYEANGNTKTEGLRSPSGEF